jgi:hydrogenase expression/formation protein HypC
MCIALPGRVISVEGNRARVDFKGNRIDVNIGLVDAAPGDYVLVHAGCAIETLKKDLADEILEIFGNLEI